MKFGEYKYVHEVGSKPEKLILCWFRDAAIVFFLSALLINPNRLIVNKISKIDVIVYGDYDQGVCRFPVIFHSYSIDLNTPCS